MRIAVIVMICLLCGCLFTSGIGNKNVEVIEMETKIITKETNETNTSSTPLSSTKTSSSTTLSLMTTTTLLNTLSTTTSLMTTTTLLITTTYIATPEITMSSNISISTTLSITSTTSTTTTSSTSTIPCTIDCAEIKYPSPRNCVVGCCISPDTKCQYVAGSMTGGGGRCRCK